ncbi:ribosome maturation factor RimM [Bacillus sp. JCM 19034]|uniref:ribosome maturation factor RimM n=1 Tax=Bacillus sp. JCM 19034 TaxID=1481928 RepID=UPI00078275B4|nr:ribosome maturation factor RimM [Bacillus sp. JCM 19034]
MYEDWLRVGKIVNTHGVRGEVRVISTTDFSEERYAGGSELMVRLHSGEEEIVKVRSHRVHKQFDLLQFEGYTSINEVEKFKGCILYGDSETLPDLDEDEYYYHEIIGCLVQTEEGEELGKIKEIIQTGANDVWVVQRSGGGKDILLPFIEDIIKDISIEEKKVTIHVMEGLLE